MEKKLTFLLSDKLRERSSNIYESKVMIIIINIIIVQFSVSSMRKTSNDYQR